MEPCRGGKTSSSKHQWPLTDAWLTVGIIPIGWLQMLCIATRMQTDSHCQAGTRWKQRALQGPCDTWWQMKRLMTLDIQCRHEVKVMVEIGWISSDDIYLSHFIPASLILMTVDWIWTDHLSDAYAATPQGLGWRRKFRRDVVAHLTCLADNLSRCRTQPWTAASRGGVRGPWWKYGLSDGESDGLKVLFLRGNLHLFDVWLEIFGKTWKNDVFPADLPFNHSRTACWCELGSSARQIQPLRPKRSHKVGPEESGNELADNEVGMDLAIHQVASHGYAMNMPWICHGYAMDMKIIQGCPSTKWQWRWTSVWTALKYV